MKPDKYGRYATPTRLDRRQREFVEDQAEEREGGNIDRYLRKLIDKEMKKPTK